MMIGGDEYASVATSQVVVFDDHEVHVPTDRRAIRKRHGVISVVGSVPLGACRCSARQKYITRPGPGEVVGSPLESVVDVPEDGAIRETSVCFLTR